MRDDKEINNNWETDGAKFENEGISEIYSKNNYDFTRNNAYSLPQNETKSKWASRDNSQAIPKLEDKTRYFMYGQNDQNDYNNLNVNRYQDPSKGGHNHPSQLLLSISNMSLNPKITSTNAEYVNNDNYFSHQQPYNHLNHDKGNFNSMNMNRGLLYPTPPTDLLRYPPIMPPQGHNSLYNRLPYFPYPFPPPFINKTRNASANHFGPPNNSFDNTNASNSWRRNGRDENVIDKNGYHNSSQKPIVTTLGSYQNMGSMHNNFNGPFMPFVQPTSTQKYVPPPLKLNSGYSDFNSQNKSYQTNQGYQSYSNKGNIKSSNGFGCKDFYDRYDVSGQNDNKFKGQNLLNLINNNDIPVDIKYWIDTYNIDLELEKQIYQGSNTGINFEKYKNIPIETSGNNCPPSVESWSQSKINKLLLPNIARCNYQEMTPVQKYAVGIIMAKRDLMACAQTGSGKTAAFLIPVMNQIMELPARRSTGNRFPQCPYALVLAPTRELALQIHMESLKFAYGTQMKTRVIYGGTKPFKQVSELKGGCHLLIATPGRLRDMVERHTVSLEYCKFLILDEADKMLDMGFEPQIRDIVDHYNMPPIGIRQTMMFSATFPKEIQLLAKDFLKEYIFLTVGKVGGTTEDITQKVIWVEDNDKKKTLLDILDMEDLDNSLILIFLERKKGVDALENFLVSHGFNACSIHGDHCQEKREAALDAFRSGKVTILLATSVASRGLDIPNVKLVINFDMPNDIDEYVHRIGRTGRVGNIGYSTTFINDKNRNVFKNLHKTLLQTKQDVPEWLRESALSLATTYNTKYSSRYNNSFKRAF